MKRRKYLLLKERIEIIKPRSCRTVDHGGSQDEAEHQGENESEDDEIEKEDGWRAL